MSHARADCPLCAQRAAAVHRLVWQDDLMHLVLADEPGQPCFFRLIWNAHVAETGELADAELGRLWHALIAVERTIRREVQPTRLNLASLGNMVPHLHWHVIGRWSDDPQFPGSVWSASLRQTPPDVQLARRQSVERALPAICQALAAATAH